MGATARDDNDGISWSPRLGAHLETARRRAGKRRLDLAFDLGVSEETIRLWEKGSVQPNADRLAHLISLMSLEVVDWSVPSDHDRELPPLARRLADERRQRSMTQLEVVDMLGLHQATFAGWETGRATPSAGHLAVLAEFLGLSRDDVAAMCASPFVVDFSGWPAFGQLVGSRRQRLRITRAELAAQLGVASHTVVGWELGYRVPSTTQLQRLAGVLECNIATLAAAMPRRRFSTSLGELIFTRRRELGLRSADVAALVGASEATMSRWANGHNRPTSKSLERLARALELPFDTVLRAAGGVG
jgi:transcriptional regulator with XRE-family HTH domain